jgi:predicted RNA-binding protein with PUA-like domain
MSWYLAKTDPDTYSIDDFKLEGETLWDGVHNNAALLFIRQMHPGDKVFIYESLSTKAIVGLAEVTSEPSENKNDPRRSWVVTMKFIKKYPIPLSLAQIKAEPSLNDFALVRQSRLSVMPVPDSTANLLNIMLEK